MKHILVLILVGFILTPSAFAEQPETPPTAAVLGEIVDVQVNGLVCDFCAQALEKVFGQQPEVIKTDVNLDTKNISVQLKKGQNLDDQKISELITEAGYQVVSIERKREGKK